MASCASFSSKRRWICGSPGILVKGILEKADNPHQPPALETGHRLSAGSEFQDSQAGTFLSRVASGGKTPFSLLGQAHRSGLVLRPVRPGRPWPLRDRSFSRLFLNFRRESPVVTGHFHIAPAPDQSPSKLSLNAYRPFPVGNPSAFQGHQLLVGYQGR